MELKSCTRRDTADTLYPFNRTAYGIEITYNFQRAFNFHPAFNRTAYGIEIQNKDLFF